MPSERGMKSIPLIAMLALGAVACEQGRPTSPALSGPSLQIADAAHGYGAGFYWLPPIARVAQYGGAFDATSSPTVEICQLAADACGTVIATYTTTPVAAGEFVRISAEDEQYHVNWHIDGLDPGAYRISVRAGDGGTLLGFADVRLAENGSGVEGPDTDGYLGLVNSRTLPIKFRIEGGVAGLVEVLPGEASAVPGATQQFTATVRDLDGNPMIASVSWASSDAAVATVDQTGLATAMADGNATITATSGLLSGSATLVVEGGVLSVSAGGDHNCVLDQSGQAYCWGEGSLGQLGDGTALDRFGPVAVGGGVSFAALEAGGTHTCGLTTTGEAYCWGSNFWRQIGAGTTGDAVCIGGQACRLTPTAVSGGFTFISLSGGTRNTCGVTNGNQAYCWGEGGFGALGTGSQLDAPTPQAVSGGLAFGSISVGLDVVCGVATDGQGYCWGSGSLGQLGNGSTALRLTPFLVSGGLTFTVIEVGGTHVCGLTATGQAYCWGNGLAGRLGNGSTTNQLTPTPVSGGLTFASITLGNQHTCGLTPEGQAYCWGYGASGQLGIGPVGSDPSRLTPVPVAGGLTFVSLGAGNNHTCGVTTAGDPYCWGAGLFGQLGTGSSSASQFTPQPVADLP